MVSHLIRARLEKKSIPDKSGNNDPSVKEISIGRKLSQNFWKTCNTIFETSEKILPTFHIDSCVSYFKKILHQINKGKRFLFPDWIHRLKEPLNPCSIGAPTYQDVARAVRKTKAKGSPCPLDMISVIVLKRCPILRTILHKLIVACWETKTIPSCWKQGFTIQIFKKGDTNEPSNFRPITLQTVLYKIYAAVIRNRLYSYLEDNEYVDKHVQKGFWPSVDGVYEHTQMLAHMMREAKRHQRTLIVTLLDLRNAFGEVNHNLIYSSLRYHNVPEEIICIIKDIYTHSLITVAHGNANTELIQVDRGVLQGDPCSPLIFNICFNPLMQTVIQSKYLHLGYVWGPNADLRSRSWLQFADDTVLISDNIKSAQSLLNLNAAWCEWAEMKIRIDKCSTFGMRKQSGSYIQLTIGDSSIPPLDDGEHFKYLGRIFDFSMKNEYIKADIEQRLTSLLRTTSDLDIKPQQKLRILKVFIPSRLTFDLRIYDISYTWIKQALDSKISNAVRDWMEFPISTCVSEILSLPANQGGLSILSLKETAEKLRLGQRFKLHSSSDKELRVLFETTSDQNVRTDSIILTNSSRNEAIRQVRETHIQATFDHIVSLKVQGRSISSILKICPKLQFRDGRWNWTNLLPLFSTSSEKHWFNNFQPLRIWYDGGSPRIHYVYYAKMPTRRTNTSFLIVSLPWIDTRNAMMRS